MNLSCDIYNVSLIFSNTTAMNNCNHALIFFAKFITNFVNYLIPIMENQFTNLSTNSNKSAAFFVPIKGFFYAANFINVQKIQRSAKNCLRLDISANYTFFG